MKARTLLAGAAVIFFIGAAVALYLMWQPEIAPLKGTAGILTDDSRNRGARIVKQGDCAVCHTGPSGQYMAGGLPLITPFGTLYTTNITPDVETGIGSWSEQAFARALRKGIARDGHLLYPAFPYVHYTKMTDQDISDAYAYVMSVDPVKAEAPSNHMMFPMNFRPLVAFWNLLFLRSGEIDQNASESEEWNRGRYLVEGLGHCSSCHTPLNLIGGEKSSEHFSGGQVDGWDAPALNTLSAAPVPWTKDQLVTYLRGMVASEHGAAAGPMLPVSLGLAEVPVADSEAIATYILALPQPPPSKAATACSLSDPGESAKRGKTLFVGACASCHGSAAPMRLNGNRPDLALGSSINAQSPRNSILTVMQGIGFTGEGPSHYMPAFSKTLSDQQIGDVLNYLRGSRCGVEPWSGVQDTVSAIRKEIQSR